jgi:hypothetical protein
VADPEPAEDGDLGDAAAQSEAAEVMTDTEATA